MGPGNATVASSTKLNAPTIIMAATTIGSGSAVRSDLGRGNRTIQRRPRRPGRGMKRKGEHTNQEGSRGWRAKPLKARSH